VPTNDFDLYIILRVNSIYDGFCCRESNKEKTAGGLTIFPHDLISGVNLLFY
jgi:hypothetical protein